MEELPPPDVYEEEISYMPYQKSLSIVFELVTSQTASNGSVLDLMCGPGCLLGQISKKRRDLHLKGVDFDKRYIDYAEKNYPRIDFREGDIISWSPKSKFEVVLCTGALHHISYEKQPEIIKKMSNFTLPNGYCIISDCYIDDYSTEKERKLAAAKLGYEYLAATISNGAPDRIIQTLIDILKNDVMKDEFKTSISKRTKFFEKEFKSVETIKTWLNINSEYGDYITILRN